MIFEQVEPGLSFLNQVTRKGLNQYTSTPIKELTEKTSDLIKLSGKVAYKGLIHFNETADPLLNLAKSHQSLCLHNQRFSECCELIADQAAHGYLKNADHIKEQVTKKVKNYPFSNKERFDFNLLFPFKYTLFASLGNGAGWLMDFHQDLIAQTIKANILHLLANLADQAYDNSFPFIDSHGNPFGRLLSVVGNCLVDYEEHLDQIEQAGNIEKENELNSINIYFKRCPLRFYLNYFQTEQRIFSFFTLLYLS